MKHYEITIKGRLLDTSDPVKMFYVQIDDELYRNVGTWVLQDGTVLAVINTPHGAGIGNGPDVKDALLDACREAIKIREAGRLEPT